MKWAREIAKAIGIDMEQSDVNPKMSAKSIHSGMATISG